VGAKRTDGKRKGEKGKIIGELKEDDYTAQTAQDLALLMIPYLTELYRTALQYTLHRSVPQVSALYRTALQDRTGQGRAGQGRARLFAAVVNVSRSPYLLHTLSDNSLSQLVSQSVGLSVSQLVILPPFLPLNCFIL
jgi:hypothetical protein